jgi:hypothetical protein
MLKWFRRRAAAIAPTVLLSLAALALPHATTIAKHDADEKFAQPVVHHAGGHAVGTPTSDDTGDSHCAICHFSRPFRLLTPIVFPGMTSVATTKCFRIDDFAAGKPETAAQPPLRAPPISPDHA